MPSLNINGERREIEAPGTLAELLARLEVPKRNLVVELNGEVIQPDKYAVTTLNDGDTIELVRFVGGG